jgi:hypothetical protein
VSGMPAKKKKEEKPKAETKEKPLTNLLNENLEYLFTFSFNECN